jgi:hypothetical protein
MTKNKVTEFFDIGYLGEIYTMYKLATLNIKSSKLNNFHDYDIITESNIKLEIKTSSPCIRTIKTPLVDGGYTVTYKTIYQFTNHTTKTTCIDGKIIREYTKRNRTCDFYILVCLNKAKDKIIKTYIVPESEITKSKLIVIYKTNKEKYREKWDLIVKLNDKYLEEKTIV